MFKADSEQVSQPWPQPAPSVGEPWSSIDDPAVSVACTSPPALVTVQPRAACPLWAQYVPATSKALAWKTGAQAPVPNTARGPKADLQALPQTPPWKAKAPPPVLPPAVGMVSKPPVVLLPPGAASSNRDAMPAASSDALPASSGARSGKPFDPASEIVGYVPVRRDETYGLWIQDTVEDENKSKVSLRPMVKTIDGM